MRRKALVVIAAFAALAALAASASSRAPAVAVPHAAKVPAKGLGPLLAVVPGVRGPVLGRADKRAVWISRHGPRLRIFNSVRAWAYAPDRSVLAVATEPQGVEDPTPALQFIQPVSLWRMGMAKLPDGSSAALAWGDGRVNVVVQRWCCPASIELASADVETHKIVSRATLPNALVASRRVGGSIVLLTAPPAGIGTANLVVIDPSGAVRSVALGHISAGRDIPTDEENPDPTRFRQNIPALAVDPAGRAFVVPATGSIAEVSLATLAVSYHSLSEPVSLLGRLRDWAEPTAEAKGISGPVRIATWLGSGVLAVTGGDESVSVDSANELRISWTPAGLRLVDTNTWGTKLIDRGADSFTVDGDNLLVTGSTWTTGGDDHAMGLAGYGFDGTRRFGVLNGRSLVVVLVFRGRVYLGAGDRYKTKVVDLGRGTLLKDRRAPLAQLLIGDGSS
jgi:hypothetical protein